MKIGPNFGNELIAAGLQEGVGWNSDGYIWFSDYVPQAQRDAVMVIVAAHDPTKQLVPQTVTRYQARVALANAGLLDQVNAHFAALPDNDIGKLAWVEAPTVERNSPALIAAAHALGLSDDQIDLLFISAAAVQ